MPKVHDKASNVAADQGEVQVDGPDGVCVSLTPEAAMETADRLTEGAVEAAGQRHFAEQEDARPKSRRTPRP